MEVEVLSLFPEMFAPVLDASILGRATRSGKLTVHLTDPRDFVEVRPLADPATPPGEFQRKQIDDTPYGGGAGMVIRPEPVVRAIESVEAARGKAHKIFLSPSGKPLSQAIVHRLAQQPRLLLLCGRYEGIDERALGFVDEEISIGDYVLSGGELAALVLIDAVARLQVGVLGNQQSAVEESFSSGLLEYPHYTRPAEFRGQGIPAVLVSGNHAKIARWRRQQSLRRTRARRPDLFAAHPLSDEDRKLLEAPDESA